MLLLHKRPYVLFLSTISLLYCVWSVNSQAFTLQQRFCCCLNLTNICCDVDEFDVQVDQSLQTGDDPDFIRTVHYGNFSRAHVDADYIKNNLNIFASEPLHCQSARALLIPSTEGLIVPVGDIKLVQITPNLCLANFSNVVEATRLREPLDLAIGFQDGFVVSGQDIQVDLALREAVVGFSLPQHTIVAGADSNENGNLDLSLNVQIGPNSRHNETCFTQSNQLAFQLGDPVTANPNCLFPATAVSRDLQGSTARVDVTGLTQSQYLREECYESYEVTDNAVVFTFQANLAFGAGCEYIEEFPHYYDPFYFTVSISSEITARSEQTLANTVQLDYIQESLELIPCSVDDEGFDQDVSALIPMGRLRFDLRVVADYQVVPIEVNLVDLHIQDVDLRIVSGPTFLPQRVNESDVVEYTLETTECLWVITQHSEQPATPENLIGCTVDYLSQMTIQANVTFADTFFQDNVLLGDERSIVYQSNNASDCPVQAITTDVTSVYNAELIVQDLFGNSENLNLDNEIVVRLSLDAALMSAFDGLTVVMEQVIVTLTSEEENEEDENFVRLYSTNDKRSRMQLDFHPYYSDGHFCRSYTPAPDNVTSATCQRFYSDAVRGEWNGFMADQLNTDLFVEDLDGQPRLAWCQDRTDLKEDRFIFKPSNWVFSEYPYSTGTMVVTATAFVRSCNTVADDFVRRLLQESNGDDGTGSTIVFQNVSFINSNVVVNNGDGNVINANTQLLQDLLIALSSLVGVFILLCCCCTIYFCKRFDLVSELTSSDRVRRRSARVMSPL